MGSQSVKEHPEVPAVELPNVVAICDSRAVLGGRRDRRERYLVQDEVGAGHVLTELLRGALIRPRFRREPRRDDRPHPLARMRRLPLGFEPFEMLARLLIAPLNRCLSSVMFSVASKKVWFTSHRSVSPDRAQVFTGLHISCKPVYSCHGRTRHRHDP